MQIFHTKICDATISRNEKSSHKIAANCLWSFRALLIDFSVAHRYFIRAWKMTSQSHLNHVSFRAKDERSKALNLWRPRGVRNAVGRGRGHSVNLDVDLDGIDGKFDDLGLFGVEIAAAWLWRGGKCKSDQCNGVWAFVPLVLPLLTH